MKIKQVSLIDSGGFNTTSKGHDATLYKASSRTEKWGK